MCSVAITKKIAFSKAPLWTSSFNQSNEIPTISGLANSFIERQSATMSNHTEENIGEDDTLDDNYIVDTIFSQDEDFNNHMENENEQNLHYSNRVHSIHRNRLYDQGNNNIMQSVEARTGDTTRKKMDMNKSAGDMLKSIENHANLIVAKMEQDPALMEDSPTSEQLRRETLRDMPQCLTLKRRVRVKLSKSVSQKSKKKPLSCYKMFKYRMSITMSKLKLNLKNLAYTFELWYGPVKQIEGNFGSGVASFFKFLRWIFILNLFVAVISFVFITVPQLTTNWSSITEFENFTWTDIFSGEGYLTNTILYYALQVLIVEVLLKQRIFCGWDYNIATEDAAHLKSHAIYTELKELLYEDMHQKEKDSCMVIFWTKMMQLTMNIFILILLFATGYVMWFSMDKAEKEHWSSVYTTIAVNVIMTLFPIIFSIIVRYEGYKSPKTMLCFTLVRTFILGFVVIGVLVTYWLKNPDNECWETSLGKEIYRLVLFDFIFAVILIPVVDIIWYYLSRFLSKGHLHFDIARNTMQVMYNQTLFWVGLFFSPFLAVIVVIKLLIMWYIKEIVVMKFCKPS
ncbi:hypothetical protein NQ317_017167 [Molorchus minor]|uniref:TMC domain-containing protein n=1 Tax=Molorchus minor TaxID=1323400 RepID=A0ABQ9IWS0_9CUCU|nr:hypothetical protein NQ317_017167 [Molorchus minor]